MITTMPLHREENEKHADILDAGRQHVEREVYDQVRRIREQAKKVEAVATGYCLNPHCEEEFNEGDRRRWCDDQCRNEWAFIQERRKQNVKPKR